MKSLRKAFTGEEDTETDYVRQVRVNTFSVAACVQCASESPPGARRFLLLDVEAKADRLHHLCLTVRHLFHFSECCRCACVCVCVGGWVNVCGCSETDLHLNILAR